jgi:hypothetical protein
MRRARELLDQHPELARSSIHTIAAVGEVAAARELLERDPSLVRAEGGPHMWEPLLYLSYSRLDAPGAGRSALETARVLLEHGADPNAGYLWEGLIPPFTALTGAFGDGEGGPSHHRDALALGRLLLEAGADPNDSQLLYNKGPDPEDEWVELLLEFGLGTGEGGPWRERFPEALEPPRLMVEDLLKAAASNGLGHRAQMLIERGVDPEGIGTGHPIYEGRTPVQEAAVMGHREVLELLRAAGARSAEDPLYRFISAAMDADRGVVQRMLVDDPGALERARQEHPDLVVRAAQADDRLGATELLIELGFDVNALPRTAALHEAAMRGDLELIELLIEHGGDPNLHSVPYDATPAGWAEHFGKHEAERLLRGLEDG